MNKILRQQVKKYLLNGEKWPEKFEALLNDINTTYNDFEKSRSKIIDEKMEAISELRNETAELENAHAELGRILNSVNYGFFSRNMITNQYTYLSSACERIYGYSAKKFFENTRLWYDVIHPEDRPVVESDGERLQNREEICTQYRINNKSKGWRWIELTLIPFVRGKTLVRVDGVVSDISSKKQVETEREVMVNELIKSNADLKQFSYITSHNLRAPLSNIQGILALFRIDKNDEHNSQMLEMLKISAGQLNSTIDDLTNILIIKNQVNPDLNQVNLEDSFKQALQTFSSSLLEIGGEIQMDFSALGIVFNRIYLESIFVNLLSNAIKYHLPGRRLLIDVRSFEDENGNVVLKFSDNGMGIDLDRHGEKVFGLYQRFHEEKEGKGLGLFIMKSQIEAAGGKISIESAPDVGTTFTLIFAR